MAAQYDAVYKAAKQAASAISTYLQAQRNAAAAASGYSTTSTSSSNSGSSSSNSSSRSSTTTTSSTPASNTRSNSNSSSGSGSGSSSSESNNNSSSSSSTIADEWKKRRSGGYSQGGYNSSQKHVSYATGGYTGSWGSEGKLAVLHEKELVLNEKDTKNILDSVSILRSFISAVDGNLYNKLGGLSIRNLGFDSNSNNLVEQSVHIEASFPNVNSKKEIEDAFNDLINLAAQRAMRNN